MADALRFVAADVTEALCKRWEGLRLKPYLCPAGVATIGYGTTVYPNGVRVTLLDPPVTAEHAKRLLRWDIEHRRLPAILRLCPGIDRAGRLGAIGDFAYNLGDGRLKTSTLRKKINAGLWEDVPAELRKWTLAAGKRLRGLVLRREDEITHL
jgi:lysozyme